MHHRAHGISTRGTRRDRRAGRGKRRTRMAKKKKSKQDELFDLLRARGLRKSAARTISRATAKADTSALTKAVEDLRSLAGDLESRVTGGGTKAKRKAAGQKAAATRKKEAAKRSTAARKAA